MSSNADFSIVYDGEFVSTGAIDARELAPALLGMADLIDETAPFVIDGSSRVSLRVQSDFKHGSFEIALEIASQYDSFRKLFSSPDATALVNFFTLIGISGFLGLFQLIKQAKGRTPTVLEIEHTEKVRLTFVGDDPLEVDKRVWNLFTNPRARKAVELLIKPLLGNGIDTFKFRRNREDTFVVHENEARYFVAPVNHENEKRSVADTRVVILSPSFKEGNKWRVFTGAASIYVSIEDPAFNAKVQSGSEAFRKGDIMEVSLETRQWFENGELKAEYAILRVYSHESNIQGQLL
jgi:hypothetical protein